jgi:predicted porin
MKQFVATAAVAACATFTAGVHAQSATPTTATTTATATASAASGSSITIYGIVDAAIEHYTNVDAQGNSRTWMPSLGGGMFPSRLGFKGIEDLGGGLKAIFTLENGVYVDTGGNGQNRLFGRQAWVGLAGDWGQVTLGRNYNMIYNSAIDFDIFGPSQYGLGSLDSAIPNGRTDNSIAYKGTFKGAGGALTVGATYSLGRDVSSAGGPSGTNCPGESATDVQACREWSAMARYDVADYAAVVAYDRKRGGAGAANGLTASNLIDSRLHAAGLARFGGLRVAGGVVVRNNEGAPAVPRSNLYYLGAAYRVTPAVTIDGQVARLDYKNSGNDTKQFMLRAIYDFSKRTSVYLAGGHIANDGTAAVTLTAGGTVGAGKAQNGIISGIKTAF